MFVDYVQPEFYHFSEDSTWLARFVSQEIKSQDETILDIFAGCGVVALELTQRLPERRFIVDLLELQSEFRRYLEKNIQSISTHSDYNVIIDNFLTYSPNGNYNVIVANPPYFGMNEGRTPADKNRLLCRHQDNFNWEDIFTFVDKALSAEGRFYFLARIKDQEKFSQKKVLKLDQLGETAIYFYQK